MATTDLIGAPERPDRQGKTLADVLAHEAAPPVRPTASPSDVAARVARGRFPTDPLPETAASALLRLERAFSAPEIVKAVTRYEVASERARELAAVAASGRMSDLDADSLAFAEDLMDAALVTLAEAGLLHLIGRPSLAEEHGKVKDPLPPRPRGPHPYPAMGVA